MLRETAWPVQEEAMISAGLKPAIPGSVGHETK